jgi:carbon monoxide dehydrogenase subunit G
VSRFWTYRKKHIEINAPVEKVFEFMEDPENLPEIWPSMQEVTNVKKLPEGGRTYDWTYKMAGIKFKGSSKTLKFIDNERAVVVSEKGIPSKFIWEYHPYGEGTSLDVRIEYEIPVPVLGKLAEKVIIKMNDNEADALLSNLKAVMEA